MPQIIKAERSIIPSCDCGFGKYMQILEATCDLEGIGAYKIGFSLGLRGGLMGGLEEVVKEVRLSQISNELPDNKLKPVIYDHQKGGTDIPDTAKEFASIMKECGIAAAIIFPFTGPTTLKAYVTELRDAGVEPIVGGEMTHNGFLDYNGGYMSYFSVVNIYRDAANLGVTNFVVPGTKPDRIKFYREMLEHEHPELEPTFFSPGLGAAQGGSISEASKVAGKRWHAIVGREIYEKETAEEIRDAVIELAKQF